MAGDRAESVTWRQLHVEATHRCSSRLLSIEAELAGIARHRHDVPGCDVAHVVARRRDGLWEVAEAPMADGGARADGRADAGDDASAQLGLEIVLDPPRLARYAAHEARARVRLAAAAEQASALHAGAAVDALRVAFDELFDSYADFLAVYRFTNERFWTAAHAWLEAGLRRAGHDPQQLAAVLWIDMTDTDTAREIRAWAKIAERGPADPSAGAAVVAHAQSFGHLFGDQIFGEIDVTARLWQRLRDGDLDDRHGGRDARHGERSAERPLGDQVDDRERAAIEAIRGLALLRLRMREHLLRCNARTREFFDRIAARIGLGATPRPLLRFLSRQDVIGALAGEPCVSAGVLDCRRRAGVCELVGDEVRIWSISEAPRARATETPARLRGQVVQPGPVVIGRAVCAARLEDVEAARSAAGPGPHILIVPMLQPAMMVAASSFAAVLATEGGLLSHAAMLAREYRVPCITGLRELAGWANTGVRIAVDPGPGRGTVERAPDVDHDPGDASEADPNVAQGDVPWIPLCGAGELGAARFGGKAHMLRRMFDTMPIPDGLCLSSDATRRIADWDALCHRLFDGDPGDRGLNDRVLNDRVLNDRVLNDRVLDDRALDDRALDDRVLGPAAQRFLEAWFARVAQRWRPPTPLRDALRALGPCVIRSSSVDEDRPGSSSAGLLVSVPSAAPADDLPSALAQVLRSALSPAYLRYRRHRALPGPPPCPALLIQRRIECRASGVLTTWRPAGATEGRLTLAVARGFAGNEAARQLALGVDPDDARPFELYPSGADDNVDDDVIDGQLAARGMSRRNVRDVCSLAGPIRRAGIDQFELEWCLDAAQRPFVVQVRERGSELR